MWVPPAVYRSFCEIDVRYFPFDVQVYSKGFARGCMNPHLSFVAQTCELKFKSWTFGGRQVELHHLDRESDEMDTSAFVPSGSWDVVSGERQT